MQPAKLASVSSRRVLRHIPALCSLTVSRSACGIHRPSTVGPPAAALDYTYYF
jgi:hypothetical protein